MTLQTNKHDRRIYNLDRHLTEEQMAVVFAMTSRSPQAFDETAQQVTKEKAADFHEKWVVGYGHSSVAEHAVLHLAVENISRLACDTLEDNRLASYTEKSSRYQVFTQGSYHIPREIKNDPDITSEFQATCNYLFDLYTEMVKTCVQHLQATPVHERQDGETNRTYTSRLTRIATDSCRSLLPAATLTNVGMTANARTMEHAITKLLSSNLTEEKELGQELLDQGLKRTPTLIKYAQPSRYLTNKRAVMTHLSKHGLPEPTPLEPGAVTAGAKLIEFDPNAAEKLTAALMYTDWPGPYEELEKAVQGMETSGQYLVIEEALNNLGEHEAPAREFEAVSYLIEFTLDYGAYREFKRHRMQTVITHLPSPDLGYTIPPLIEEAGLLVKFQEAMDLVQRTHQLIKRHSPSAAPYILTHAHHRRLITRVNLRECYHMLKLRTSPQAHAAIRGPMNQALSELRKVHPVFFDYPPLRLPKKPELATSTP